MWAPIITIFCIFIVRHGEGIPMHQQKCVERLQTFLEFARKELPTVGGEDLHLMCEQVPAEFTGICRDFLASIDSDRTDIAGGYITTLCAMLDQMELTSEDGNPLVFNAEIEPTEVKSDEEVKGLPCLLCTNIMKIAHMYLSDEKHQEQCLKLLKGLCHFIPVFGKQCTDLVDRFGKLIIHLAANWLQPSLCHTFHICTTQLVDYRDMCRLCEFGTGIIQDTIEDPSFETRIIHEVEGMCEASGVETEMCKNLKSEMGEYLPGVITSLRKDVNFAAVCKEAGLCGRESSSSYEEEVEEIFVENVELPSLEVDEHY